MNNIEVAVRVIVIKSDRVLLINNIRDNFYYFIGGKLNFGESFEQAARRELNEETDMKIDFKMIKPLYIQEFIKTEKEKHKLEIFILGEIDKFEELQGLSDPEHDGTDELTWENIYDLPQSLLPIFVLDRIEEDYRSNFEKIYVPHYVGR